jgi:hypothetical protein
MSIPESHVAGTVPQVHEHVQLGVQRSNGNCDTERQAAVGRK